MLEKQRMKHANCCGGKNCNSKKHQSEDSSSSTIATKKLTVCHSRALVIASQSHDIHTKVAALLIDPKTLAVMAEGYNGFIRGGPDDKLPTTRPEKYDYIVHAETNLLCNAVRSGVKTDGCIVYCTLSPCTKCIRMLWQAGISEFYFKDKYKDFEDSSSMLDLQIDCEQLEGFYYLKIKPRV
jgi:dCMP deaminase